MTHDLEVLRADGGPSRPRVEGRLAASELISGCFRAWQASFGQVELKSCRSAAFEELVELL